MKEKGVAQRKYRRVKGDSQVFFGVDSTSDHIAITTDNGAVKAVVCCSDLSSFVNDKGHKDAVYPLFCQSHNMPMSQLRREADIFGHNRRSPQFV